MLNLRSIAFTVAAVMAGPAIADKPVMPTTAQIDQERARIDRERKAMFDPRNPATAHAPNMFPRVETPTPSDVDLEAFAQQYRDKAEARKADALLVFASFTMPKASLARLIADTAAAGGAVVLRGFKDGSIKTTGQAINELGKGGAGVQINLNAFTTYRIAAVPAVVLVKADGTASLDGDGCALPDSYAIVSGDVELGYALEVIEQRFPDFAVMAARYARPLKAKRP